MRVVHQVTLLLVFFLPAFARRGESSATMETVSSPAATTTYRPFEIYGPIWGVNTMWNIECHDLSHLSDELSNVNKVQQVKRVVQHQGAEKIESTPHSEHEYDGTNPEVAVVMEVVVPPAHETGWFRALEGVEHEYENTSTKAPPPHTTGWFKALKGVEQEYDNFRVDHRF